MKNRRVLLIDLNQRPVYAKAKVRAATHFYPSLCLATLAASCLKNGHLVRIFDMNLSENTGEKLVRILKRESPDLVGITFTTPFFSEMKRVAQLVKKNLPSALLVAGGAHASFYPKETLENSALDLVVVGEGDFALPEILSGKSLEKIKGICFKKNGQIKKTKTRELIANLDSLPYPAWGLHDLPRYKITTFVARANPVGWMETSRGCVYGCVYCCKAVFGRTFRPKSAKRVVDEIEYMLKNGFKEIHIGDDCFSYDIKRAEEICGKILARGLKFFWSMESGLRVDCVNQKLLQKMKQAGCYRVWFGIESGSQRIIRNIKKGINLNQVRQAVKWAKKAGLEVAGFFMIALPGEKVEDIEKTIQLATNLDLDIAKMTVTIPLPATPLYDELEKQGRIKTKNWSLFNPYMPAYQLYDHDNLDWVTIEKYFSLFYRQFYLNPRFLKNRLASAIKNRTLISDIKIALKTKW